MAVQPVAFSTITVALAVFVSAAPILSASLMSAPTQLLADLVPLVGRMLSSMLRGLTRACEGLRSKREQIFVLLHGALTYMSAISLPKQRQIHPTGFQCRRRAQLQ